MGDRALIILEDSAGEISPVMYLHWNGYQSTDFISETEKLMESRGEDLQYAFARLVGIAHSHIDGNLSLGVWSADKDFTKAIKERDAAALSKESHGDNGIFIVNCKTWEVKNYH